MRTYTDAFVIRVAYRAQERAFYAGAGFGLAFIGFALTDRTALAAASALLLTFSLGVSVGAWILARRFR